MGGDSTLVTVSTSAARRAILQGGVAAVDGEGVRFTEVAVKFVLVLTLGSLLGEGSVYLAYPLVMGADGWQVHDPSLYHVLSRDGGTPGHLYVERLDVSWRENGKSGRFWHDPNGVRWRDILRMRPPGWGRLRL